MMMDTKFVTLTSAGSERLKMIVPADKILVICEPSELAIGQIEGVGATLVLANGVHAYVVEAPDVIASVLKAS
jgi:hypothetical protein